VHQYGGFLGRSSGGGDWRIGGNSSALTAASVGLYNLHGGILQPNGNFQIGAWGTGTLNLYGGLASCSAYPVVGRFPGSFGTLFVSGGVFDQTGGGQLLIIGEEGTGTLTVTNTGLVTSTGGISVGHTATGIGTVNLDGGTLATTRVFQNGGAGAFSTFNFNGGTLRANANNVNFMAGLTVANVLARGAVIDTTNFNVTIDQPLVQDLISTGGGLTKLGAGALTLRGANTYAGLTVVSNGTLVVNGTIAGSATVKSGATLGGNGTIAGVVTVEPGGALGAGTSIGALSLNASPVLNGIVFAEVDRNGGAPLADKITVVGNPIAYSGTLAITNVGAPLVVNDTFTLFNAPGYSGTFTLASQTPGQIITWDTANLTVNGTIRVLTAGPSIPTTPTNITVTVSGGNIQVSWPTNYTGWRLEAQTNALSVGLSNNWGTWPGSTSVNVINMPIDPAAPTVFFRLVYP
jgi:autotransporter-associated beta strand protein/T5SS/PEP-CTERM-associated repeat protein